MKKILKVLMVVIMLVGTGFSIVNIMPVEINAEGNDGHWEEIGGSGLVDCYPPGTECSVNMAPPK